MLTVDYWTLTIGIILMVGGIALLIGRRSVKNEHRYDREVNLRDEIIGGRQQQPVYVQGTTDRSRFGWGVRESVFGAILVGTFLILYDTHPWTDRHGHYFGQMIACDMLLSGHETCAQEQERVASGNTPVTSNPDRETSLPVTVQQPNSSNDNEPSDTIRVEPLPIAPPCPIDMLPPYLKDEQRDEVGPYMTYEKGSDAFADAPIDEEPALGG